MCDRAYATYAQSQAPIELIEAVLLLETKMRNVESMVALMRKSKNLNQGNPAKNAQRPEFCAKTKGG